MAGRNVRAKVTSAAMAQGKRAPAWLGAKAENDNASLKTKVDVHRLVRGSGRNKESVTFSIAQRSKRAFMTNNKGESATMPKAAAEARMRAAMTGGGFRRVTK